MPNTMLRWTLWMLSTRNFPYFESTTWKALVLQENITKLEGVGLNTSALLSWGFCCLFVWPCSQVSGRTCRSSRCWRPWPKPKVWGVFEETREAARWRTRFKRSVAWEGRWKKGGAGDGMEVWHAQRKGICGACWHWCMMSCMPCPLADEHDDCVGGLLKLCKNVFLLHVVLELKFLGFNIWISG